MKKYKFEFPANFNPDLFKVNPELLHIIEEMNIKNTLMMQRMSESAKQMQKNILRSIEPINNNIIEEMNKKNTLMMQRMSESTQQMQKNILKGIEPINNINTLFASQIEQINNNIHLSLLENIKPAFESIARTQDIMKNIAIYSVPQFNLPQINSFAFESISSSIDYEALGILIHDLKINNSNIEVIVEDDDISYINNEIKKYAYETIDDLVNYLIKIANSTVSQKTKILLIDVINRIIITSIVAILTMPATLDNGTNTENMGQVLSQEPYKNIDEYRFVLVECTNVRDNNSFDSNKLSELKLGKPVKVVEQRDEWTLVEWKSEDSNCILKGWVAAENLGKFFN